MKTAILLSNLGTPSASDTDAVGKYLKEFFSDPLVIPLPTPLRWALANLWIIPRRAPHSAEKYKSIWTEQGSPLLVHSLNLQKKLQTQVKDPVLLGMRYGNPSLESAVKEAMRLEVGQILLVPLYPQYAKATTESTKEEIARVSARLGFTGQIKHFSPFSTADFFIQAQAKILERRKNDHVLFTFHGLPESQVKGSGPKCLLDSACCAQLTQDNQFCYRAQCFATARKLAETLKLSDYSLSFQSRLGRAKWIGPYTEDVLPTLPKRGIKNISVVAPSFVADCLETLEELGIRGKEVFLEAGGESYELISCVNSEDDFVQGLAHVLKTGLHEW